MSNPLRPARLALAALLLGSGVPVTAAAAAPAAGGVVPAIEWERPDRFGVDRDRDGLVDLPNDPAYVAGTTPSACGPECPGPAFPVLLRATIGEDAPPGVAALAEFQWTIDVGTGPPLSVTRNAPEAIVRLPEGPADVLLRVVVRTPLGWIGRTARESIVVDDILVVAIGDSYASGEGNPEIHRGRGSATWGDGLGVSDAAHAAARRSSVAWPAQVALQLERADPHSSVTFVSVASSGATIEAGLLGPQKASIPEPQVEAAARLAAGREIDLLLVSIGGNDIGFAQIIAGLVDADPWLDPVCYGNDLDNVWASVADGVWDRASHLSWTVRSPFRIGCRTGRSGEGVRVAGLDRLPAELDRLAAAMDRLLSPARTVITEYPDPTGSSEDGVIGICGEIVGDAAPLGLHEISRNEQILGRTRVVDPLNDAIRDAARRHGWSYTAGIADAFARGHGYCAAWPDYGREAAGGSIDGPRLAAPDSWYRNGGLGGTAPMEGPVSWYRTAGQSAVLQGPDSRVDTTGTLHPNELGHLAMADAVIGLLGEP